MMEYGKYKATEYEWLAISLHIGNGCICRKLAKNRISKMQVTL